MKRLSKILLTSIAPITVITTTSLATSCGVTKHKAMFFKTPEVADTIYVVDASTLDNDVIVTLQSLQGILAQEKAQIYIKGADHTGEGGMAKTTRDEWFDTAIAKYGCKTENIDAWSLIKKFKDSFNSKYIVYKNATISDDGTRDWNKSINLSTTIAGVEHYLMISDTLETQWKSELAKEGITKGMDGTNLSSHVVFRTYKNKLNNKLLINQSPYDIPLRDYAIASKALTIYLEDEVTYFRDEISKWVQPNSPILGWNKGELGFVATQSAYNLPVLAADHCTNLSFYSNYKPKKLSQWHKDKIQAQDHTHYVAILMSDGDNLQWLQDNFTAKNGQPSLNEKWFGYEHRGNWPMSWTMSPAALDLNPTILEYLYAEATSNDEFVAGPSGYAYANMAQYQDTKSFAKATADYMKNCDLQYVNVLDYYDCDASKFKQLMKQSQIKGAVWCNRDLYMSGHGSVDWIKGKPIVSMREGLWSNVDAEGKKVHEDLSPKSVAERISGYPKDPSIIDGYTIVTANSWALGGQMAGIEEFVNYLKGYGGIKVVTVGQILQLIKDNVKHQHAVPAAYGPCPDVPD